jgi:hypothetical protein
MKSSRNLFIALAAVSFVATSVGCYTMLKHPRVKTDDRAASAQENEMMVGFGDDCAGCHSPGSLYAHHAAVPPPRAVAWPTWSYYYDNPWWFPYYTPVIPGGAATSEEEQKKRPFDRRRLSRPDESNPSAVASPEPVNNPGTIAKPADSGNSQPTPPPSDSGKRDEKRSGDNQAGERRTRKPQ